MLEFWSVTVAIVAILLLFPYVRCFVKRIAMVCKLKACCKRNGYRLIGTHPFWMLSSKSYPRCDFYIETPYEIYAVKLFGTKRRAHTLIFTDQGEYFFRKHFILFANTGGAVNLPNDTRRRPLPQYDLRRNFHMEWEIKTPRSVLLIHPVCHEIRLGARLIGAGETVCGYEIYSLSRLMGRLEVSAL